MITNKSKKSIFDMAFEYHEGNNEQEVKLVEMLDTAIKIRRFMDSNPRMCKNLLNGNNISAQLKYWYKKRDERRIV